MGCEPGECECTRNLAQGAQTFLLPCMSEGVVEYEIFFFVHLGFAGGVYCPFCEAPMGFVHLGVGRETEIPSVGNLAAWVGCLQ